MKKKRLYLRLKGGLGNQLFQYAAAKNIALKNEADLVLDIQSGFKNDLFNRKYALEPFKLNVLEYCSINKLLIFILKIFEKCGLYKIQMFNKYFPNLLFENTYTFNEDIANFKFIENAIIDGYFHSEKYFLDIRNVLLKELEFKINIDNASIHLLNRIQNGESVSLHIRNYANSKSVDTSSIHGICTVAYYSNAISLIKKNVLNPKFFVFSDDIQWAKNYLKIEDFNCQFIEKQESRTYLDDFRLMMSCKHNIIANSSFSWWCAWLNNHPNKIVIAPDKWLDSDKFNFSDVVPDTWIKIGTS